METLKTLKLLLEEKKYRDALFVIESLKECDIFECLLCQGRAHLGLGWQAGKPETPRVLPEDKPAVKEHAEAAIKALEEAVKLSPKNSDAHYLLSEAYCLKLALGNPIDAFRLAPKVFSHYEQAVKLDPNNTKAYISWGAYGRLNAPQAFGGGPKPAIEQIEKALSLNPQDAEAHYWLGVCHQRLNNGDKAKNCWQKALELNPSHQRAKELLAGDILR
jgi:tetratricopeptide (TPR) repeat protein